MKFNISERTVGAALRGRPRLKYTDSSFDGLGFGEHDLNRGRPRRAAPTVRSTVRLDIWTTRRRRRIRG